MKLKTLTLIDRKQGGFTLIELIVALAITVILSSGVAVTVFQIFNSNTRSTAQMSAIKQVEIAIHWISRDAQMAQIIDADPTGADEVLKLQWTEWGNTVNEVTYSLIDGELKRSLSENGGEPTEIPIAQYIIADPAETDFTFDSDSKILTFKITASVGAPAISETREGKIKPRAVL